MSAAPRQPAAQFPRGTAGELATALGVHRNSISRWSAEGAPAGPPYCELAWRTWAAAQAKDCPTAPEQTLLELLAQAGLPTYRRLLDDQRARAAGQQPAAPPPTVTTATDWDQENKRLQAQQRQLDLDKARRRVIEIEDLHRLVEAIALAGAAVLNDAPRLAEILPLSPADRQRCQAVIETELAKRRAQLVEQLRAQLAAFLVVAS
jgi:hypothetical protein